MMQPGGRAFVPLDVGPLTAVDATRRLLLWSYAKFAIHDTTSATA